MISVFTDHPEKHFSTGMESVLISIKRYDGLVKKFESLIIYRGTQFGNLQKFSLPPGQFSIFLSINMWEDLVFPVDKLWRKVRL